MKITHDWPNEEYRKKPKKLSEMYCPQCKEAFRLTWTDYKNFKQTLWYRYCPSSGVYDMGISCPHCDYEEQL